MVQNKNTLIKNSPGQIYESEIHIKEFFKEKVSVVDIKADNPTIPQCSP